MKEAECGSKANDVPSPPQAAIEEETTNNVTTGSGSEPLSQSINKPIPSEGNDQGLPTNDSTSVCDVPDSPSVHQSAPNAQATSDNLAPSDPVELVGTEPFTPTSPGQSYLQNDPQSKDYFEKAAEPDSDADASLSATCDNELSSNTESRSAINVTEESVPKSAHEVESDKHGNDSPPSRGAAVSNL